MVFDGNASTVIFDGNGAVVVDLNDDGAGETCHCFVDGVIDDLADEVVQTSAAGIAADCNVYVMAGRFRTCS